MKQAASDDKVEVASGGPLCKSPVRVPQFR